MLLIELYYLFTADDIQAQVQSLSGCLTVADVDLSLSPTSLLLSSLIYTLYSLYTLYTLPFYMSRLAPMGAGLAGLLFS